MITPDLLERFIDCANSPDDGDLPRAALLLGQIEEMTLDPAPAMRALTRLGAVATARLERLGSHASAREQISALNSLLFVEERFAGNDERYDDPRNSFLHEVLARRTGIPISLSVIYLEVARRSGVPMEGVNFPGHFLVRCRPNRHDGNTAREYLIDPFHNGALLDEADCRALVRKHLGEDAAFDRRLLAPANKRQILMRMLVNLKRLYVAMRSFPQARDVAELLLALDPSSLTELRDRGLIAYHLEDFTGALRDLEHYLHSISRPGRQLSAVDEEEKAEYRAGLGARQEPAPPHRQLQLKKRLDSRSGTQPRKARPRAARSA